MASPVSSYFARVGIDVDTDSLNKVDAYFRALEGKFSKIKGRLGNGVTLRVNAELQFTKSYRRVNEQLKQMGNSLTLTIKKLNFAVNAKQIKSQAEGQLRTGLRVKIDPYITRTDILAIRRQIQFGLTQIPVTLNVPRNIRVPNASVRGGGGSGGYNRGGGGLGSLPPFSTLSNLSRGLSGFFLRGGVSALPFIGGAMGIQSMQESATRNQSMSLAANTIFEGKLPGGGQAAQDQLMAYSNKIGLDFAQVMPEYNRFMSTAMGSMDFSMADKVFKSISAFGMTHGSDPDSVARAMKAFTQMSGKNRVGAEELRQQLADAAGFGMSTQMFAEAYAELTKSGKSGQEAIAALEADMKKGKVQSNKVIPIVARMMEEKSRSGLQAASETSTAEQNRARNARFEMNKAFQKNGGEKGLATMWMALERVFTRLQDRMPQIGALFEKAMNIFAKAVDGFMDISDALFFGRDSELSKTLASFGLSLTGIRDFVAKTGDVLGKLSEALGPSGVLAALAAVYGIKKATSGVAGEAVKSATDNVVDRVFGNSLASYSVAAPGGKALRVVIAGFGAMPNAMPDINTPSGSGSGGGNGHGSTPKKQGWRQRAGGWLGKQSGKSSNLTLGVALALGGLAVSELPEEKVNPAGTLRGPMGASPFGWLMAKSQDLWGEASNFNANRFTESKISAATPITDRAMQGYIPSTVNHQVDLKANIKIEASTADEALVKFRQELDAQVRQSFLMPALKEAQSTFSNYAK